MKSIPTSKQITSLYFSIVAFAIIAIHASVFEMTTEDIEQIYAQNRLNNIEGFLMSEMKTVSSEKPDAQTINQRIRSELGENAKVYFDTASFPGYLKDRIPAEYGVGKEIINDDLSLAYFFSRVRLEELKQDVFVVLDNRLYELSEEELFTVHSKQVLVSLCLLFLSLLVVLKISDRLTKPFSALKQRLEGRTAEDLAPIELPDDGVMTQELVALVDTLNLYQARVEEAMKRERSFNRYVSHELRSPLMVMKGAIQLLSHGNEPAFIEKQQQRLLKATQEMQEFIETLLELTKTESLQHVERAIEESEIKGIIENQRFLIASKPIEWRVNYVSAPHLNIPEAVFHILLANLIKNAFAYTDEGLVEVVVTSHELTVSDTGSGLSDKPSDEGYGLGLLLVKDICHRYQFEFEIGNKDEGGCIARIRFNPS